MATTSARPPKSLAALALPGGTIGSRAAVRKRHALTLFGAAHSERKKHAARSPALRWHRWTALVFLPAVSPCTTRLGAGAFLRERRATRFFRKPRRPRGNQNGLVEKESVAREGEEGGRRGEGVMGGAACSTRGFVKSRADSPLLLPPPSRRARARTVFIPLGSVDGGRQLPRLPRCHLAVTHLPCFVLGRPPMVTPNDNGDDDAVPAAEVDYICVRKGSHCCCSSSVH